MPRGGSQRVEFVLTAQDRDAIQSMAKMVDEIRNVQQALMGTGKAGEQAGQRTGRGWRSATRNIQGALLGFAGIASAQQAISTGMGLLISEMEEYRRLSQDAAKAQEEIGKATKRTMSVLAGAASQFLSPEAVQNILTNVKTPLSMEDRSLVLDSALSAGSSAENALRRAAIASTAMEAFPEMPTRNVTFLAAMAAKLDEKFKIDDMGGPAGLPVLTSLAQMLQLMPAIATNQDEAVRAMGVYAGQMANFGFDPLTVMRFGGAVAEASGDTTFERTSNALIKTMSKLEEIRLTEPVAAQFKSLPEFMDAIMYGRDPAVRELVTRRILGPMDQDPQLLEKARAAGFTTVGQYLANISGKELEQITPGLKVEAKQQLAIWSMLQSPDAVQPLTAARSLYENEFKKSVQSFDASVATYVQNKGKSLELLAVQLSNAALQDETVRLQMGVADPVGATRESMYNRVRDIEKKYGRGPWAQWFVETQDYWFGKTGGTPEEAMEVQRQFRDRLRQIASDTAMSVPPRPRTARGGSPPTTAAQRRFRRMISEGRHIDEVMATVGPDLPEENLKKLAPILTQLEALNENLKNVYNASKETSDNTRAIKESNNRPKQETPMQAQ